MTLRVEQDKGRKDRYAMLSGVRGVLEAFEELAISSEFQGEVGFGRIQRIVLFVVDSHSSPGTDWDRKESPPGMVAQLLQSSGVPIDRYSFETVETMKDRAEIVKWRRQLRVALARLSGMTEADAEASVPNVALQVVDISFSQVEDPEERTYSMNLPTSFVLPPADIDRLREVAGQLMRQSADYNAVVNKFSPTAPE